jgi:hypothetical protein
VHRAIEGIRPSSIAEWGDWSIAEFSYHVRLGDIHTALDVTLEFLDMLGERRDRLFASATTRAGISYLVCGRISEARAAYERARRAAQTNGFLDVLAWAHDAAIGMSFDVDDVLTTRRLMDEARTALKQLGSFGASVYTQTILPGYEAMLAVVEGRGEDAIRFVPSIEDCLNVPVPRWRVRQLAIHLGARLANSDARDLETIAAGMAPCFSEPDHWIDWPANIYAAYLDRYVSRKSAAAFARHFIEHVRRELYPAPQLLRGLAVHCLGQNGAGAYLEHGALATPGRV